MVKQIFSKNISYCLLISIFVLVITYFFWRSFYVVEPSVKLNIHAKWITAPFRSDICYFKRSFYVTFPIKKAWIIFKSNGSGGYVSLNNHTIITISSTDYNVKMLDISNFLKEGRNTIFIKIENKNFWDNPAIILEVGYISTVDNSVHFLTSDRKWFVSAFSDNIENSEVFFYRYTWIHARELNKNVNLFYSYNIDVMTLPLKNFYCVDKNILKINFTLGKKSNYAWMRFCSNSNYQLFINNQLVLSQKDILPYNMGSMRKISAFRIDRFLKRGNNEIVLYIKSENPIKQIYLDGLIYTRNGKIYITPPNNLVKWLPNFYPKIIFMSIENTSKEWLIFSFLFLINLVILTSLFFISVFKSEKIKNIVVCYLLISLFVIISFLSLNYDIRFVYGYFYKPLYFILSLIIPIFLLIFIYIFEKFSIFIKKYASLIVLVITCIAFILRCKYFLVESLHPDESALCLKARGIWHYLYPSIKLSPDLPVWYVTTSEFLSFLQAIFLKIFNSIELGIRLPSLIAGTLTVPIIFLFSKVLTKNVYIAIFSSLFFAFLPTSLGIVSFGRYPSLLLLMGLCSLYFLLLYFEKFRWKFFVLSMIFYLLTYFSWQGSIFFYPVILFSIFYFSKTFYDAIKLCLIYSIVILVIGLHLLFRFSLVIDFPAILYGKSISGLTPTLSFLKPFFSPFYYLWNFFLVPSHQFLSGIFGFGILVNIYLLCKSKPIKNLIMINIAIFIPLFLMTCFLEIYNYRYSYYLLPYLIIGSVMSLWKICQLSSRYRVGIFIVLNIICFIISTDFIVKIRNFPYTTPQIKNYYDIYYYSRISKYFSVLSPYIADGDIIIALQPHLLKAYKFRHGLYLETRLVLPVVSTRSSFLPLHRVSGDKALVTIEELKKIEALGRRVWIIMSPLIENFFYSRDLAYIKKRYILFYEDINTLIFKSPD